MLKKFLQPKYKVDLVRLGNSFDGGYLVPKKIIKNTKTLLSFGLGDDWSFEKDFRKYNNECQILCFDSTVNKKFWYEYTILSFFYFIRKFKNFKKMFKYFEYKSFFNQKKIEHYRKNLVPKIRNIKNEISVKRLEKIYCKENIFIKMDIEGEEWRGLFQLKNLENITGMIVEFHDIDLNEKILERILQKLNQLAIVHIHSNNMGGITVTGDPKVIEITFLNKKYLGNKKIPINKFRKHPKDFLNDPMRKDIKINFS